MSTITTLPRHVLAGITVFSGIQALGRFSDTSRTALEFFNSTEPWIYHGEFIGLPRGLRRLAHVKAFYEELPEVKKKFTTEIRKNKESPFKYPVEVEGLADKAKSYQDLLQMKQVMRDHLYATTLFMLHCNRTIDLTPSEGGAASADNKEASSSQFAKWLEDNSKNLWVSDLSAFPKTISVLRELASRKNLLTDPRAVNVRVSTVGTDYQPTRVIPETHRIITRRELRSLEINGPLQSIPEEVFGFDVDVLDIYTDIPSLQDLTLPELTRDYPNILMLNINSKFSCLPASIRRLVNLRMIQMRNWCSTTVPEELLFIPNLQNVVLPGSLRSQKDSEVVRELKRKGATVYFQSDHSQSSIGYSSDDESY